MWAASYDDLAHGSGTRCHFQHRRSLDKHARQENHIGPSQIGILKRPYIHVAESHFPVPREHRCNREDAKRRKY
jgi:hypothetical protein